MTERWHPDERLPVIARFEVRRRAYLAPDGSINRQLPAFAPPIPACSSGFIGDGAGARLRCEGGGIATHRSTRDLCRIAWPGGGVGWHGQRHA
jgi:hypothetical protein